MDPASPDRTFRHPSPSYMKRTLRELKDSNQQIGTYGNIHTVSQNTPVITALHMFVENRVSALPIVDENNRVIDIYAKFDVIVSSSCFYGFSSPLNSKMVIKIRLYFPLKIKIILVSYKNMTCLTKYFSRCYFQFSIVSKNYSGF